MDGSYQLKNKKSFELISRFLVLSSVLLTSRFSILLNNNRTNNESYSEIQLDSQNLILRQRPQKFWVITTNKFRICFDQLNGASTKNMGHSVIGTEHLLQIEIFCKFYDISYLKIKFSLQETNQNLEVRHRMKILSWPIK